MKKERLTTSDEQRERQLIAEQIERAAAEGSNSQSPSPPPEAQELKRAEGEKVVLSLAPKTSAPSSATATPAITGLKLNSLKANPLRPNANPLKTGVNPLKRLNPLKQAAPSVSSTTPSTETEKTAGKKREMTAAERLISEDQERKRRRMEREAREPVAA